MFDDSHASLIQRSIDDALACQDMLARTPAPPSLLMRLRGWLQTIVPALIGRSIDPRPHGAGSASLEPTR